MTIKEYYMNNDIEIEKILDSEGNDWTGDFDNYNQVMNSMIDEIKQGEISSNSVIIIFHRDRTIF